MQNKTSKFDNLGLDTTKMLWYDKAIKGTAKTLCTMKGESEMTKKEIYAAHGIEYKAGKILYHGQWIAELLKEGNSKTGKRVYTWSMTPGKEGTCICDCEGCYAKTGFFQMPNVKKTLALNTSIVNEDINFFYRAVSAQLETIGAGEVRIHAAGDFKTNNPDAYANTWHRIVKENPSFLFWTYTKMTRFETLFDDLPNGNIVKSVIDGIGFNFGHCDYIINTYRKLQAMGANVYICRCGIDKNQHCENCGHCGKAQFVLFIEHSTAYKAEQDPRFEELKALIENQAE